MRGPTIALVAPLVAALLACDVREQDAVMADSAAVASGDSAVATLSPAELERLAERYPVLGAEPAPEPQPRVPGAPRLPAALGDLPEDVLETVRGEATYYADKFEGRRTASGIPFRQNQMVAAHRAYPFGTLLRVTNVRNDRSVNVRVVDRGPWGAKAEARRTIIDLSRRAAERLGYTGAGRTPVKVEVLEWGGPLASAQ